MILRPEEPIIVKKNKPYGNGRKAVIAMRDYIYRCSNEKKTPYLEEIALLMGVSDVDLKEWAESDDDFKRQYQNLLAMQKLDFKRKALTKKYDPKIVTMLLSAEHNVVEVIKKQVTGEGGGAIKVENSFSAEAESLIRTRVQEAVEEATKLA